MQLDLSKKYQVLLGEADTLYVCLVGVGGTGSALALSLGRLAYHLKEKGINVDMTLVDHDIVEESNLGRQLLEICGIIGIIAKLDSLGSSICSRQSECRSRRVLYIWAISLSCTSILTSSSDLVKNP